MDGLSTLLAVLGIIGVFSLLIRLFVGPSIGFVTPLIWGAFTVFAVGVILAFAEDGVRLGEVLIVCAAGVIAVGVFGGPERPTNRR